MQDHGQQRVQTANFFQMQLGDSEFLPELLCLICSAMISTAPYPDLLARQ
jgi:hypothetical protein